MSDSTCIEGLAYKLSLLHAATNQGLSREHCLRRWSEFVRERDGHRCVDCHSAQRLSAHHICRKSFIANAQFQTGNGITLCSECHKRVHKEFNGRPNLSLPVDAQGGENLPAAERYFSILTDDAVDRGLMRDDFYFLSDTFLSTLKKMQGYDATTFFPGARIEQAYLILAECEVGVRRALLLANGAPIPDRPLLPGGVYLVVSDGDGQPYKGLVIQTYVSRSKPSKV